MKSQLYSKIYIIGSVASGKTTMAKKLSKLLNIPWHELDSAKVIMLKDNTDVFDLYKKVSTNLL